MGGYSDTGKAQRELYFSVANANAKLSQRERFFSFPVDEPPPLPTDAQNGAQRQKGAGYAVLVDRKERNRLQKFRDRETVEANINTCSLERYSCCGIVVSLEHRATICSGGIGKTFGRTHIRNRCKETSSTAKCAVNIFVESLLYISSLANCFVVGLISNFYLYSLVPFWFYTVWLMTLFGTTFELCRTRKDETDRT